MIIDKLDWNNKAQQIRKKYCYDSNSPIDIEKVLENQDEFTLTYCPMSDNISGLCINNSQDKIIAVNSSSSYGRQRFTLAHELCHLYYHDEGCYVCSTKNNDEKMNQREKEADIFASYILAPYYSFNEVSHKFLDSKESNIMNAIVKIEQHFGISHFAVLTRLKQEYFINKEQYEQLHSLSPSSIALDLGFSDELYLPTQKKNTTGKYIRLTKELLSNNSISQGKYNELLLDAFRIDLVYGEEENAKID